MNFLLGVCGGIAAYKSAYIISGLKKLGHTVDVVMTPAACQFINPLTFETLSEGHVAIDLFQKRTYYNVEHIEYAKRADFALIAPATANTIAKLAAGIADNLLTTIFLALKCQKILIPAMNSAMYENSITRANIDILSNHGFIFMQPAEGKLACGDIGKGRMPEPDDIINFVLSQSYENKLFIGKKFLITAGPTREPIDPVRFLSNRSSGKMGYALANAAVEMGAEVCLISGPTSLPRPYGVNFIPVITTIEMKEAINANKANKDAIIMCAAVADFMPEKIAEKKIKKSEELIFKLIKTPDILKDLGENKSSFLIGFAAETDNLTEYAEKKLHEKNLDMIVANDVSISDIGFESNENAVTIFTREGNQIKLKKAPKIQIARQILIEASKLMF